MSAITVDQLSRRFGGFQAVDGVSFEVSEGEIFGYLGANGAGKSTTIRMLCGLLAPTSGDAIVAGHRLSTDSEGIKRSIGYMSQKFSLYPELTVAENFAFFGGAYGMWGRALRRRVEEVAERVGLAGHTAELTEALPGGMRQRVALGCAILHQPRIVFLDEPTAGVDPAARRRFWALIRELAGSGTTIFVTTHYMDEAEYCNRVGLMVAGRLPALDTPEGLKRTFVPGDVWTLRGPGALLPGARARLRAVPGVLDVQALGVGLRVRVTAGMDGEALGRHLSAEVEPERDESNLEDVFLAVVDADAQRQGTARAFGGAA